MQNLNMIRATFSNSFLQQFSKFIQLIFFHIIKILKEFDNHTSSILELKIESIESKFRSTQTSSMVYQTLKIPIINYLNL